MSKNKKIKIPSLEFDPVIKFYKDEFDKKLLDKVIIVSEKERLSSGFKNPTSYYIIDPFGYGLYFKSIKRNIAQDICDKIWGVGKFNVIRVMKAEVR